MKTFKFIYTLVVIVLFAKVNVTNGANILVVAPFFASSHTKVVQTVTLNLAKRGHELTVITGNLLKDPPPKYREIFVDYSKYIEKMKDQSIWRLANYSVLNRLMFTWNETFMVHDLVFESEPFRDFIENDKSHYDVVIVEMFFEEVMYHFAHKYKAPLILLETSSLKRCVEDIMGNPFPVSYVPFEYFIAAGEFSFLQRAYNWFIHTIEFIGRKYHYLPMSNEISKKIFKSLPEPLPNIEDLEQNVSLILTNTHYSIDTVLPLVPGIIQIGGIHIEPPKSLPQNIKKFLDEATEGVIVFTMGTHVVISTMEDNKMNAILKVFASLKQRVVMKWEGDSLPVTAPNIMALTYLPQNDVLAHPNVKAFITHGGMLGIQEAVSYGVPLIGIPLFADQFTNVARLVHLGTAVKLELAEINEKNVRHSIDQVINVPSYREMAFELSKRFNERPMGPVDTAMYWIEYVIKFKGTPFLKSPLVKMPWYKYRMIDVAAIFISLITLLIVLSVYLRNIAYNNINKWYQKLIIRGSEEKKRFRRFGRKQD